MAGAALNGTPAEPAEVVGAAGRHEVFGEDPGHDEKAQGAGGVQDGHEAIVRGVGAGAEDNAAGQRGEDRQVHP